MNTTELLNTQGIIVEELEHLMAVDGNYPEDMHDYLIREVKGLNDLGSLKAALQHIKNKNYSKFISIIM